MRSRLGRLPFVLFVILLSASAYGRQQTPAGWQDAIDEEARAQFTRGRKQFIAGSYEAAIASFQAAYQYKPFPLLLFNVAQSARMAGKSQMAIEYYQRYIEMETQRRAPELERARLELIALKKAAASVAPSGTETREATSPVPQAPPATPPAAEAPPVAAEAEVHRAKPTMTVGVRKPWYKDAAGDALVGCGVAFGAVGVGVWASGYSEVNAGQSSLDSYLQAVYDKAPTREIVGLVGIGLGGALLLSGVIRYALLSPRHAAAR